jgi:hypothetical protein
MIDSAVVPVHSKQQAEPDDAGEPNDAGSNRHTVKVALDDVRSTQ